MPAKKTSDTPGCLVTVGVLLVLGTLLYSRFHREERPQPMPPARPQTLLAEHAEEWPCDEAPTCPEIDSCERAQYYLEECGIERLDRDGDGFACEATCRD